MWRRGTTAPRRTKRGCLERGHGSQIHGSIPVAWERGWFDEPIAIFVCDELLRSTDGSQLSIPLERSPCRLPRDLRHGLR